MVDMLRNQKPYSIRNEHKSRKKKKVTVGNAFSEILAQQPAKSENDQ